MYKLGVEEEAILDVVRQFVDDKVKPVVKEFEHADAYPSDLIDEMKRLGIYGLMIPEPYGFGKVSAACFALVTAELSRGWMSLAGAMGGHSVVSSIIDRFGTDDQKNRLLPKMATGEIRGAMALTEPGGGSDLQAMTTTATLDRDHYVVRGSKIWITNAERAGLIAVMLKTDPAAEPRHKGISILLMEPEHGYTVSKPMAKLGYKGVESSEVFFDGVRVPTDALLGGVEGNGFAQMMSGLEVGRIQVAARAVGVAQAAFDDSMVYAREREAFGVPIWKHQAIGHYLADMATELEASKALLLNAAVKFDAGERSDLEAGMAKLFASEACERIAMQAMRIHGSYGYSPELDIERYYRDAPLMIIGEGTNEIQRNVIVRELMRRKFGKP